MKATNLQKALLSLRYGVFLVMVMWTIDKFINPEHNIRILSKFYSLDGFSTGVSYAMGASQLIVVLCFVLGVKKKFSYGLIFLMHAASTLSSYAQYMDPWKHLLFFTAWPMLAAVYSLYLLRDEDTLLTIK